MSSTTATYHPEMTTVEMPEAGIEALSDYSDELGAEAFRDWLQTDEGQRYLKELREALPRRVRVYRGINGVLQDDDNANRGDYGDEEYYNAPRPEAPEGLTSYTEQEDVAMDFATGRKGLTDTDAAEYGTVISRRVPADQIVYHAGIVEDDTRYPDEAEIIALHD